MRNQLSITAYYFQVSNAIIYIRISFWNKRVTRSRVTDKTISTPGNLNTLRPRQYGRHFPDDIFKRICLNENVSISLKISLKFVPKVQFNNIPALLQIMAWRRPGDKPLSEPMVVSLLTHICVTRPQWVKCYHTEAEKKWLSVCKQHFQINFVQWKLYFDSNFTEICSQGSNWR